MALLDFLIKVVVSAVFGMIIGWERESRGKPAGLRTNALVAVGSTIFTYISLNSPSADPMRVAANIIVGVGFIGAGTIFKDHNGVNGLTTAAALWISAAVGTLVGFGMYLEGLISIILCFIILKNPTFQFRVRRRKK